MERKQTVIVPEFNHSTIQQILQTNTRIIQILKEYQNQGFHGTPEQQIYQIRLQTNLTFLATIADALYGKRTNSTSQSVPPTSTVPVPKEPSRSWIIKSLPPPVMILSPHDAISKPSSKDYYPVPPLVGQNPVQEMALSGYTILDAESAYTTTLSVLSEAKEMSRKKSTRFVQPIHPTKLEIIQEDEDSDTEYQMSDESDKEDDSEPWYTFGTM
jgi:hypothetical protein